MDQMQTQTDSHVYFYCLLVWKAVCSNNTSRVSRRKIVKIEVYVSHMVHKNILSKKSRASIKCGVHAAVKVQRL